ncbi:hypothetical protein EDD22DRAFT_970864, partial [Suillus occidentalis]
MQLSLLLIALTSMLALAVAYPMSEEMMAVAKREAFEVSAPVSRAEEEEAYAAFCCYDDKSPNKRCNRRRLRLLVSMPWLSMAKFCSTSVAVVAGKD